MTITSHYRVISEPAAAENIRTSRGTPRPWGEDRVVDMIKAISASAALNQAQVSGRHGLNRIISVEELIPERRVSNAEITVALTDGTHSAEPYFAQDFALDPEDYEESDLSCYYASPGIDFITTAYDIAEALRASGLCPGLHLGLLQNESGFVDYLKVEVRDEATNTYRSVGADVKHLTDDPRAFGWHGVLAIARRLISLSEPLH